MMVETHQRQEAAQERREEDRRCREGEHRHLGEDRCNKNALTNIIVCCPVNNNENVNDDESGSGDDNNVDE